MNILQGASDQLTAALSDADRSERARLGNTINTWQQMIQQRMESRVDPVFISYEHAHSEEAAKWRGVVEEITKKIEDTFYATVFWDVRIKGGAEWAKILEDQASACKVMLVLVGKHWSESEWVVKEVNWATGRRARIVPVLIDGAGVPKLLNPIQAIPLSTQNWDSGIKEVLNVLSDPELFLAKRPTLDNPPLNAIP
jgi:TIR domain